MTATTWAKVGADNVVISVEIATGEWVEAWQAANPGSGTRYLLTEEGTIRQANAGWTYDPSDGNFYPPRPDDEDAYWDEERWNWVVPIPPMPEGDGWVWDAESREWVAGTDE